MAPTGERGRGKGKAAPGRLAQNSDVAASPAAPPSGGGGGRGRGPGRKFNAGQSGNPGGRPKLLKELKERIQARGEELIEKLFAIAVDPPKPKRVGRRVLLDGPSAKERVMAIEKLLAYGYGKPVQAMEITGKDGTPIQTADVSPAARLTSEHRIRRILELAAKAAGQASAATPAPTDGSGPQSADGG